MIVLWILSGEYGAALHDILQRAGLGKFLNYPSTSTAGYETAIDKVISGDSGDTGNQNYLSSIYEGVGASSQTSSPGSSSYEQQNFSGTFLANDGSYSSNSYEKQSFPSTTHATDAQNLYRDSNPEVIRRPALEGAQTYTQRVLLRFLQPPAIPSPGVCILKNDCMQ